MDDREEEEEVDDSKLFILTYLNIVRSDFGLKNILQTDMSDTMVIQETKDGDFWEAEKK